MAYKIVIFDERLWKKDCSKIEGKKLVLIFKKIRNLKHEPSAGNVHVKQLQDYVAADFRLRIGDYRVLFNKDEETKTIHLLRVLHRSKLY